MRKSESSREREGLDSLQLESALMEAPCATTQGLGLQRIAPTASKKAGIRAYNHKEAIPPTA